MRQFQQIDRHTREKSKERDIERESKRESG